MALTYNPFGPAYVVVNVGEGLVTLGMSQAGIEVRISRKKRAVMSDAAGPDVPAELQAMGMEADVSVDLIAWDTAVLAATLALASGTSGGGAFEGIVGQPGALVGTQLFYFALYLPSTATGPYYFPTATIRNPDSIKVGTEYAPQRIQFYAWPFTSAPSLTSTGNVLYQRTPPA